MTDDEFVFPEDDTTDDWDDAAAFATIVPDEPSEVVRTFGDDVSLVVRGDDGEREAAVNPVTGEFSFTMTIRDTDPDWGVRGVPPCPACDVQDALQLSTGEWVCNNEDCKEVFDGE